jgi:crossover junction endodeoxyribonuclease RuvC|tara:strand:+ start:1503 stop:2006 length:504 start_codon:yes stop_codon:yes gene_type:complete
VFVLGIDPGLSRCGYGVLEQSGRKAEAVAIGVIRTPAKAPLPQRLASIHQELRGLVEEYRPDVVAIERVFFQMNARTAMGVAQVSGLAMAIGNIAGAEVFEYTPNQVKEAVAGWGSANKEQMQRMVQSLLALPEIPSPPDAADAAAVALCHLAHASSRRLTEAANPS